MQNGRGAKPAHREAVGRVASSETQRQIVGRTGTGVRGAGPSPPHHAPGCPRIAQHGTYVETLEGRGDDDLFELAAVHQDHPDRLLLVNTDRLVVLTVVFFQRRREELHICRNVQAQDTTGYD